MRSAYILLPCKLYPRSRSRCSYFTDLAGWLAIRCLWPMLVVIGLSVAQTVTIDPVGAVTVVEGNDLTINCTDGVNTGFGLGLRENGILFLGDDTPPTEVNGMVRIFQLSVGRAQDGNTYDCEQLVTAMTSSLITLTVICKWNGMEVAR